VAARDDNTIRSKTTDTLAAAITTSFSFAASNATGNVAPAAVTTVMQATSRDVAASIESALSSRYPLTTHRADYINGLRGLLTLLKHASNMPMRFRVLSGFLRPFSILRMAASKK